MKQQAKNDAGMEAIQGVGMHQTNGSQDTHVHGGDHHIHHHGGTVHLHHADGSVTVHAAPTVAAEDAESPAEEDAESPDMEAAEAKAGVEKKQPKVKSMADLKAYAKKAGA